MVGVRGTCRPYSTPVDLRCVLVCMILFDAAQQFAASRKMSQQRIDKVLAESGPNVVKILKRWIAPTFFDNFFRHLWPILMQSFLVVGVTVDLR